MSEDKTDQIGSLNPEEIPLDAAAEQARQSLDSAIRSLWDVYTAAEAAARRTLTDAETDLDVRLTELNARDAELDKRERQLESAFEEANRLLNSADHQHRVADDRIREADKTTERAAETLSSAMEQAERLLVQAAERSEAIEGIASKSTAEATEAAQSIIAVAEEDANAIIAQAQQRAEKLVNDAELKAEKTMEGARIYKELQLAELASKEEESKLKLRELMQSIATTLEPGASEPSIDLRSDLSLPDPEDLADSEHSDGAEDANAEKSVVDEAVRRAFDQWASEGSTS